MVRSAVVLAAALVATGPVHAAERPNVLVILTDDMRWDALGVVQKEQGKAALFPWFKTPNLDRLAAEGVRFPNAFCTTSLCSPSRASLLSGRYAHRHGVLNNFTDYPNDLPSYPAGLRATGYDGQQISGRDDDRKRRGSTWDEPQGRGYLDTEFNVDGERKWWAYDRGVDAAVDWMA